MGHKQLTQSQRYHIYGLWSAGYKQSDIAKAVGVHKSTISREFKHNIFWWNSRIPQYKPDYAQAYVKADIRLKRSKLSIQKKFRLL